MYPHTQPEICSDAGALEQGDSLALDAVYCRFILKGPAHGLTNYKDTKIICRIYWCSRLVIESVMSVFPTQLCEPSLWSPSPPPFSQSQCTIYTDSVRLGGGGGCRVVLETKICRSLTLCFWPDSEPTKLLYHLKQKPRRGGDLSQINTCRKVPLKVNFFRWRHLALLSLSLICLRYLHGLQFTKIVPLIRFYVSEWGKFSRPLPLMADSDNIARRPVQIRPEFESRLGKPRGGPLPSESNKDNKTGTLRVVHIYIYCMSARLM